MFSFMDLTFTYCAGVTSHTQYNSLSVDQASFPLLSSKFHPRLWSQDGSRILYQLLCVGELLNLCVPQCPCLYYWPIIEFTSWGCYGVIEELE